MLKAYFWKPDRDSDDGLPVIAENASEAKKLAAAHWSEEFGFDDHDWFFCQRVNRIPDANIDGLPKGVPMDLKDCLRRGLISWTEGEKCDGCGEESHPLRSRGQQMPV